uniref:Uncharacterized protein n=1 Tax=Parascaris univalens TaxID=6257 RepID=A0A915A6A6_PARUN
MVTEAELCLRKLLSVVAVRLLRNSHKRSNNSRYLRCYHKTIIHNFVVLCTIWILDNE